MVACVDMPRKPEYEILVGDCLEKLREIPENCISAVVTDPPYELGFMGKKWDQQGIANSVEMWREVLRVLKPGGHLLAFGGTRTYHRMTCAIEDAGFEIRDTLCWLYGSGFPKSLNISKAIDAAAGAEREVTGVDPNFRSRVHSEAVYSGGQSRPQHLTAPSTDLAKQWSGWGTALKPAHEPIIMARKPFEGTVAANVTKWGTGGINVDGSRIHNGPSEGGSISGATALGQGSGWNKHNNRTTEIDRSMAEGRWPANVILNEEAAAMLDEQTGVLTSGSRARGVRKGMGFHGADGDGGPEVVGSSGGASRFYYVAKASRFEREEGCDQLPARTGAEAVEREEGSAGVNNPRAGAGRTAKSNIEYVSVKEVEWVCEVLRPAVSTGELNLLRKATVGSIMRLPNGCVWSMCWCGSPATDPFHPVVRSIIETATSSTIGSRTLNSSTRPHTNGCMAAAFGEKAFGGSLASCAANPSPWMKRIGTSADKAGPSTEDADLVISVESWLRSEPEKGGGRRVGGVHNFHPT